MIEFKYENIKLKKECDAGLSYHITLPYKLYDKIIKMPSKSHETIPLSFAVTYLGVGSCICSHSFLLFLHAVRC
jgi:hypothetical protein